MGKSFQMAFQTKILSTRMAMLVSQSPGRLKSMCVIAYFKNILHINKTTSKLWHNCICWNWNYRKAFKIQTACARFKKCESAEYVGSSSASMGRERAWILPQAQGKLSTGELTAWKETLHDMHTAKVTALAQH